MVVVVVVVGLGSACVSMIQGTQVPIPATVEVSVSAGDTLWALAREHPVQGQTTGRTVELIKEINDLDSGTLYIGSILRVPGSSSASLQVASR